jgi:hypothetical protein
MHITHATHSLSLSLSLSHTHTHTHARTHAHAHTHTHARPRPQVERDLQVVREMGLTLVLDLNTHAHADHVTGDWGTHAARDAWRMGGRGAARGGALRGACGASARKRGPASAAGGGRGRRARNECRWGYPAEGASAKPAATPQTLAPAGTAKIKEALPNVRSAMSAASGVECVDVKLRDGDELAAGGVRIKVPPPE